MQAPYFPTPAPAQQPVRVRLSCDSCSAAKVKCDKTRPSCERCSSNQLHCTYSVSRRHGCKRRVAGDPAALSHGTSNMPQQPPRASIGSSASTEKRQSRDNAGFASYDTNELSGGSTPNEGIAFHNGNDLPNAFQYLADDDFTMDVDGTKFSDFAFGNSLATPCDPSLPSNQQEPGSTPWTSFSTPPTAPVHSEDLQMSSYNVTLQAASKDIGGNLGRHSDSHKNPNQATGNEKFKDIHDCESYALALLRSLHHCPLYSPEKHNRPTLNIQGCTVSGSYLANGNPNPEMLPSLDTILYANKCALAGVVKLLDCPCARRPHLATLYMSVITKMLSLYEIAATADAILSGGPSSASHADATHNPSGHRLARTTIIQVGVFDLDDEDQTTLQRGILLRELRKMERAIEKFASLGGGGDVKDRDLATRQWHNVAVSMIKKELQRIYQDCKERLLICA